MGRNQCIVALLNTAAYIGVNGNHFLFYLLNGKVVYIGATVQSDPLLPAQQCSVVRSVDKLPK